MAEWGEKKVVVALVSNDDESLSALVIASVLALLLGIIFCYLIRRGYKSRLRKLVDMVRMRSGSK
jgi:ABC-type sulfate transport system permease component